MPITLLYIALSSTMFCPADRPSCCLKFYYVFPRPSRRSMFCLDSSLLCLYTANAPRQGDRLIMGLTLWVTVFSCLFSFLETVTSYNLSNFLVVYNRKVGPFSISQIYLKILAMLYHNIQKILRKTWVVQCMYFKDMVNICVWIRNKKKLV